jgi:serine/threonine protein phosphatase 1
MARTLVIGDIHGGFRALRQVTDLAGLQSDDRLIFLGDYVDGWSQSPEVIEYLLELETAYACTFLLGNHDAWCEEWLSGWGAPQDWLFHGGQATVDSYAGIGPEQRERHLGFFSRALPYYEDGHRRLFIHAGFSSVHGPAKEHFPSNFFWDRTLWETAVAVNDLIPRGSKYYPRRLMLYDEIFIGHTPTTNYDVDTPMHRCNVWNIDTGAAFQGRISMMDIDTKQYWQSDVVQQFYPGEKGRNK